MRLKLAPLLTVLAMLTGTNDAAADDVRVDLLTFNIRFGTTGDGVNSWARRHALVFDVIRTNRPDFCGLQEALRFQIDAIRNVLPEYAEHGVGRDDGKTAGEYSPILYLKDRWTLDRGETLWLSDTPHKPGSTSWGNSVCRIVTWGRFLEKSSGAEIFVFNTHFDHQSQPSRLKSAKFLSTLIAEKAAAAPVVVMGDFNAGEQNPVIKHLMGEGDRPSVRLVDTFRVLHPKAKVVGTFNGFQGKTDGAKIDFVFADPSIRVEAATIDRTNDEGRYPSDHFPVSAQVVLPAQ